MTAFTMPLEAKTAIQQVRNFHGLVLELAATATAPHADSFDTIGDSIGARLHGRVGEFGYGMTHNSFSQSWQSPQSTHLGSSSRSGEIGYVLVALADETLIRLIDWPGAAHWPDRLLEERVFGTRVAGDRVFALVESLQHRRDAERIGLAAAIYVALLLGFRGRYADNEPPGLIDRWLDELHPIAFGQRSSIGHALEGLDACSIGEALDPMPVKKLPALRPWVVGCAAIVTIYLGVGHLVWQNAVETILSRTGAIHERLE